MVMIVAETQTAMHIMNFVTLNQKNVLKKMSVHQLAVKAIYVTGINVKLDIAVMLLQVEKDVKKKINVFITPTVYQGLHV